MPRSLTTHIDSPKAVGSRLRAARERASLSQRQLAFPGCTAAYISRIEAGARVPSLQMINQLALRLDVSGQWLATGVEHAAAEIQLVEAEVALRLGEVEEAERRFRAHLDAGDPARGTALAGLGQIAFRSERLEESIELLEHSLRARNGQVLADPGAVDTLGRAYAMTGALETSIALFTRALDEAHAAEAPVEELRFSVLLANALIDAGDFGAAERVLASVIRMVEASSDPVASARVFWSQSRLHSMREEPQLASRYARRALDILERTENDAYVGMAYHLLAHAEVESGNGEEALQLLERGRALFGRDLGLRDDAKFSIEEARAFMALDRHRDAARAATRALELIDSVGPGDRGRAYVALAEVFRAVGDAERSKMLLEQALELLLDHGTKAVLEAARPLAALFEAEGNTAAALAVLKRATGSTVAPVGPAPVSA